MARHSLGEKYKKIIPVKLVILREEHPGKPSQREIAKAVGIGAGTYAMYETGERVPSLESVIALADYHNVTVDFILGRTFANSFNSDMRGVCDYTGLSESAVNRILEIRKKTSPEVKGDDKTDKALMEILSKFLQDPSLGDYLTMLRRALVSQKTGDSINSSVIKKEKFYKTLAGQEYEEITARLMTKDYLVDSDDYDTTTF